MAHFNHVRDSFAITPVIRLERTITCVKTLAERLRHARLLRGLTQGALAELAHCTQGTIGNVEAGLRQSLGNLIDIARALNVSPDWLYDGRGPAPRAEISVAEPASAYVATRWLFSRELFLSLEQHPAEELAALEDMLRAALRLAPNGDPRPAFGKRTAAGHK